MYCKRCGKEFNRGVFCPMCGTDNTSARMKYRQSVPPMNPAIVYRSGIKEKTIRLIRSKKWVLPAAICGAAAVIAAVIIFFVLSGSGSSTAEKAVEDYYSAYQNRSADDLLKCVPDDFLDDVIDTKHVSRDEIEEELQNSIEEQMDDDYAKSVETIAIKFIDAENADRTKLKNFRNDIAADFEDVINEFDQESINKLVKIELKVRFEDNDGGKLDVFEDDADIYKYNGEWYFKQAMSDILVAADSVRYDD